MSFAEILQRIQSNDPELTAFVIVHGGIASENLIALSEALKENTRVTELTISSSHLGPQDAVTIAEMLKVNTTLTDLNLSINPLSEQGIRALCEALHKNSHLLHLNLWSSFSDSASLIALSKVLATRNTLTDLGLQDCSLGAEGAGILSEVLKTNTALKRLDISKNSLGSKGIEKLSDALKTNTTLAELILFDNLFSAEDIVVFFKALKINTSLKKVDFMSCFNVINLDTLFKELAENTTLTHMNLSVNEISSRHVEALCHMIKTNTTLEEIDLSSNEISPEDTKKIYEALKTNTTLTKIALSHNPHEDRGTLERIEKALKENRMLLKIKETIQGLPDQKKSDREAIMLEIFKEISEITEPTKANTILQETLFTLFSHYHVTRNTPMMLKTLSRMQPETLFFQKACSDMNFHYTSKTHLEEDPTRKKEMALIAMLYIQQSNASLEDKDREIYGQLRCVLQGSTVWEVDPVWEVDLSHRETIEGMLAPMQAQFLQADPSSPTVSLNAASSSPAALLSSRSLFTPLGKEDTPPDSIKAVIDKLPPKCAPEALHSAAKKANLHPEESKQDESKRHG